MDLDILWIILGVILLIIGIIGCVLPVLPGPVFAWGSLLILQLTDDRPFTAQFLIVWALVTAAVTLIDNVVPVWGTKKMGGSTKGVWGATFGLIIGIFIFPPVGLIIGPFIGAYFGELIAGNNHKTAIRAGLGSFIGFIAGTIMKLVISIIMGYYFVVNAFQLQIK
jgi:uncharacterized protein YqgC (DUF456 family)